MALVVVTCLNGFNTGDLNVNFNSLSLLNSFFNFLLLICIKQHRNASQYILVKANQNKPLNKEI